MRTKDNRRKVQKPMVFLAKLHRSVAHKAGNKAWKFRPAVWSNCKKYNQGLLDEVAVVE